MGPAARIATCPASQHFQVKRRVLTRLVLQLVNSFSSLGDFCDVISHDVDGVVDLRLNLGSSGVAAHGCGVRRRAPSGNVGIIWFSPE